MNLIKTDERFKNVFHFYSDDETKIKNVLSKDKFNTQFSFVNWIYVTTIEKSVLIGTINKNGKILTIDYKIDGFILCDYFHEIPFLLIKDYLKSYLRNNNYKVELHGKPENREYLDNLKFYAKWCKDNNIEIDQKYLEILKP